MTLTHCDAHPRSTSDSVINWLLDTDPAIRWQVMRDLTDTPPEIVAAERSRVASEGWGPRLLDQQRPDGQTEVSARFLSARRAICRHRAIMTATVKLISQFGDRS